MFCINFLKRTNKSKKNVICLAILLAKFFFVEAPITIGVELFEDCFSPRKKDLDKVF